MSLPTLTPKSTLSAVVLPITGTIGSVDAAVPYKIYSSDTSSLFSSHFLSGAVDQVSYVYKKLGGDILDIELTEGNVYAAYEEAVLEYSYLVNVHQATNILSDALGNTTGSFDSKGVMQSGPLSSSLGNTHIALKYTKFDYGMTRRVADGIGAEVGLNGAIQYTASFNVSASVQDYNLQTILEADPVHGARISGKKVLIKKVYYKTPHAMWRFFGYYGGINTVGNLSNYGQFSDDSTFELVPTWQNKAQAIAYEDAIYTRVSHFSYELKNNMLRLFPAPYNGGPRDFMIEYSVPENAWHSPGDNAIDGVNNMNTLPIGNLPFENINAIGKQWIRRFALALCKEMLGQVRSKFSSVPIPGQSITLNGSALLSEAKTEQNALRDELKATLAELTYAKLAEQDANMLENTEKVLDKVPNYIFVG